MHFRSLSRLSSRRKLSSHLTATICALTSIMILSIARSEPMARESRVAQAGSIKGKVVADIPDQRKPLAGVIVS